MKTRDPFEVLKRFDDLPNAAVIADPPSAILLNMSTRTLRRNNPVPRVLTGPRKGGRRVGDLRAYLRGQQPAA